MPCSASAKSQKHNRKFACQKHHPTSILRNAGVKTLAALLVMALTGCAVNRTQSTLQEGKAYAVSRDEAKQIVNSSLAAYVSGDYTNPPKNTDLTASGYVRLGFDTQTINVTALPVKGKNHKGATVDGFAFMVADWGTIGYHKAPTNIFNLVKQQATAQGETLSVK